jgi:transcriptional regulator with XRE-family HTH domain
MTITDMARKCDISHTFMRQLITGERHPSLDMLFRLADGLEIPFEELAMQFVGDVNMNNGQRTVPYLKINNKRSKGSDGLLTAVREKELKEYYPNFKPDEIMKFVRKYLRDVVYKDDYEKWRKEKFLETMEIKKERPLSKKERLLNEILSTMYDLDETSLMYIKDHLSLYLTHFRKNK